MSNEYLNENDLIRRGDIIAAIGNVFGNMKGPDDLDVKCQFARAVLSVPPASENTAVSTKIVLDHKTVQKKIELAEKILELDRKIARIDKSMQEIGNGEKKVTCSMVITCDTVMPFTDIDVEDAKTMLRNYRVNLRVKLDALWDEFATVNPWQLKEDKQ